LPFKKNHQTGSYHLILCELIVFFKIDKKI